MELKDAQNFYKLIKDKFSSDSKYEQFFEYFEDTWIPLTE